MDTVIRDTPTYIGLILFHSLMTLDKKRVRKIIGPIIKQVNMFGYFAEVKGLFLKSLVK